MDYKNRKNRDISPPNPRISVPAPATVEEQEPHRYRFHEGMIDWKQVEAHGITKEYLQQRGLYSLAKRKTRPKPLYTEATLLTAMETAGKLVTDEKARGAMMESGLGTKQASPFLFGIGTPVLFFLAIFVANRAEFYYLAPSPEKP